MSIRIAILVLSTLLISAHTSAQTATPGSVVVNKGKSATVTITNPCDAFLLPFISPGFSAIVKVTPEATLPTTSQDFLILGKKAGETEVSFTVLGELIATGQGTCDTDAEVQAGVIVLDPKGAEKAYKGAAKQPLKDLKSDLGLLFAALDQSLKDILLQVQIGSLDGVAAYKLAHANTCETLGAMHGTLRECLQTLSNAGTQILGDFGFAPIVMPSALQPGGGGAHDQLMVKVEKSYSSIFRKLAKAWTKFDSSVEKMTEANEAPVTGNFLLLPSQLPAFNGPVATGGGGGTPPPAPPRAMQMLFIVAAAPANTQTDGNILLGGLANNGTDYDAQISGPDGFDQTLPINIAGDGVWITEFIGTFDPGNYTTKVASDCDGQLPFLVRAMSYPSSR